MLLFVYFSEDSAASATATKAAGSPSPSKSKLEVKVSSKSKDSHLANAGGSASGAHGAMKLDKVLTVDDLAK